MARGKEVYEMNCVVCHLGQGEGLEGVNPPLAGSDYLMKNPEKAARAIKFGQRGEIVVNGVTYNSYMAELGLYDDEIADVMNYIMNSWGNKADTLITEEWVAGIEKE
ncbi:MAG: cytochrome c [Bacteroidetes bacterium]|nr:MAG: cytochrome c [Bacteroidota bacterium]